MHWTTEKWSCLYCGAEVGAMHAEGCAVAQTDSSPVWLGPPITPGMLPRLVVENDIVASYLKCLHCELPFSPGDVMYESRNQAIGIHGTCVLNMAQMVPRDLTSPEEIEDEFERRRAEILGE